MGAGGLLKYVVMPFEMMGLRAAVDLHFVTTSGEVSRGETMALRGTDPESYMTEHTVVYEVKLCTGSCLISMATTAVGLAMATTLSHQSVFKVVLQKSIPAQIRQLILHISNNEG